MKIKPSPWPEGLYRASNRISMFLRTPEGYGVDRVAACSMALGWDVWSGHGAWSSVCPMQGWAAAQGAPGQPLLSSSGGLGSSWSPGLVPP